MAERLSHFHTPVESALIPSHSQQYQSINMLESHVSRQQEAHALGMAAVQRNNTAQQQTSIDTNTKHREHYFQPDTLIAQRKRLIDAMQNFQLELTSEAARKVFNEKIRVDFTRLTQIIVRECSDTSNNAWAYNPKIQIYIHNILTAQKKFRRELYQEQQRKDPQSMMKQQQLPTNAADTQPASEAYTQHAGGTVLKPPKQIHQQQSQEYRSNDTTNIHGASLPSTTASPSSTVLTSQKINTNNAANSAEGSTRGHQTYNQLKFLTLYMLPSFMKSISSGDSTRIALVGEELSKIHLPTRPPDWKP